MAIQCLETSREKTKCSSKKRPQFGSWIWFIVVNSLISLPCIFSQCLGVYITVAMYPQGDIRVLYGDPLEILCIAENYTSSDIEFLLGGKPYPSQIVNDTTIRLYIEKPEKQSNTYYCKNKITKKKCTSRVVVDSPPANVTDFSCLSKNLDILNCSWKSPETKSRINYVLTFLINGNSVQPCNVNRFGSTKYCVWNTTSMPRYRQQEEEFVFNLTSCNMFGCNIENIIIDHFSIVKPDPPLDLRVLSNGTHSVMLQWRIPNNMVDLLPCGVDHRIEYQIAKIDNTSNFHAVDATMLPPGNKTYRFQINNLPYAHMQYEVRIYIKSKKAEKNEFWSNFNYIVFYTDSEKPLKPPDMMAGGFNQAVFNTKRVIYVYWKQLEEYEEAGANFTYKVLVQQGNRSQIVYPDKYKSLSYVVLDNASQEAIDVHVWSFNMIGSSENSSNLYIPSESDTHTLFNTMTSFTKLAYENGTYELSWDGIDHIDNYTLFWCQHNSTQICAGRMNFTVLEPNKNKHVINLPRDYRYQFAISANNGTKTSGMVWAKCDISKDGIAMYGFPVHLSYGIPGKTSVTLKWSMDCALQDGIITGYIIKYCPVINTSSLCDDNVGHKNVTITDPKKMDKTITDLLPFRTYQVTIALNTTHGLKTIENATAVFTTAEDTPSSPRNITIFDVKNDSMIIAWDSPLHRNGNIGKYVIYNYGKEFRVDKVSGIDSSRRQMTLTGLKGFTNYSLSVQACNIPIDLCSKIEPTDGIFVRTRIGPPDRLKAPILKNKELIWEPPENPAGTVDLYQIRHIKDYKNVEIINTTELLFPIIPCEGVSARETYEVRALNFDEDPYHGVMTDKINVILPEKKKYNFNVYVGEWSEPSTVACRSREGMTLILILPCLFVLAGTIYLSIKFYKRYRKMKDIKPVLPSGLGIPEKDISKYTFGGWNPNNKEDKPSSDEMLLLPNNKNTVSTPEVKQKDGDNCGSSDHTLSTALSGDKQASTSDDGSNSSLHLEVEPIKSDNNALHEDEDYTSISETANSHENMPYLNNKCLRENPTSGYVQTVKPASGYVQTATAPANNPPPQTEFQPSTSYVMAGLSSPIFTTGVAQPALPSRPAHGYVRPEDSQSKSMMNFPKLGPSPTKVFGPESLPTMPTLPPPTKHDVDSSYIQLQSLDALPSFKPVVRNTVPLKPPAASGYVSPGDAVINKHLNNILSAGQLADEPALLDPTMSPDAYCRFSWSADPTNDNLHSLLADSSTINPSKN